MSWARISAERQRSVLLDAAGVDVQFGGAVVGGLMERIHVGVEIMLLVALCLGLLEQFVEILLGEAVLGTCSACVPNARRLTSSSSSASSSASPSSSRRPRLVLIPAVIVDLAVTRRDVVDPVHAFGILIDVVVSLLVASPSSSSCDVEGPSALSCSSSRIDPAPPLKSSSSSSSSLASVGWRWRVDGRPPRSASRGCHRSDQHLDQVLQFVSSRSLGVGGVLCSSISGVRLGPVVAHHRRGDRDGQTFEVFGKLTAALV